VKIFKLKKIIKPLCIIAVVGIILIVIIDNFIMPAYVQKGKTIKVPDIVGLPIAEANKILLDIGLKPKEAEYKYDRRYKTGTVVLQNPIAESQVKKGRGIYLTISGGEELVSVPNLRGKSTREAAFNLERYGLKIGSISYEPSDDIFPNTIIRQGIQPNKKVSSGSQIDIVISQGRSSDMRLVPDVSSKTITEAEKMFAGSGFRIGKITYQINQDLLPNTILEQSPRAGLFMQLGTVIDLIVAQKTEKDTKVDH
jgi:eukaryotic-like serine/threonine-protein kinase